MKNAILTWFDFNNYGTKLQAYALQKYLNNNGYETFVVKYLSEKRNNKNKDIKTKIFNFMIKKSLDKKNKKFENFTNKYIQLTNQINKEDLEELNSEYDNFIVGSDQIWNPNFFDETYFLNFVSSNKKLISYAPSFGVSEILDEEKKEKIKLLLKRFNSISVREEKGSKIVENLIDYRPKIVLDPTFLLDAGEWTNLIENEKNIKPKKKKYILCYFLGEKKFYWEYVKKIKKETGYNVIIIPMTRKAYLKNERIEKDVGPIDFLNLIKNAEIVCTDSFHGAVFSIIFEKNFSILKRFEDKDTNSQNSRIDNLVNILGIKEVLVSDNNTDIKARINNYEKVNNKLKEQIEKSKMYLKEALEK